MERAISVMWIAVRQDFVSTVKDAGKVKDEILKQTGSRGIVKKGQGVQVIYGPHVTVIKANLEDYLETAEDMPLGETTAFAEEAAYPAYRKGTG